MHLKQCSSCRDWLQQSQKTLAKYRQAPAADIDEMRFERMIEAATRYPQKRIFGQRLWIRVAAAALILAAMGLGGHEIALPGLKALLSSSGEPVSEKRMVDALWMKADPLDYGGTAIDSVLMTMNESLLQLEEELFLFADTELYF
ncbi:hypothetical protein JW992_09680 [candidate division KSB1 bacterium]|nr:hypothetical protein [candidate division KSB1 bacterium]